MLLVAGPALADEPQEHASSGLYRPAEGPPPSPAAAVLLVEQLIAQARAERLDEEWLVLAWRPVALTVPPSPDWYARLQAALGPGGALGDRLRATDGIVATVTGPDYVRVLVAGEPLLGAVVRMGPEGWPLIDRLEPTACNLCTEPARFVRDLLADVTRRRAATERLLPGVELFVADWLAENPSVVPHHWLASLQARNQEGGHLAWLLAGARVAAVDGDVITVRLAEGTLDPWTVVYRGGSWQVDYGALSEESPLRLSPQEARAWRSDTAQEDAALHGWTPSWVETPDGAGSLIGDRAVGAAFDPRDGTVLVGVLDLDRTLAGLFRVDPERHTVVERFRVPAPAETTPIPWQTWFERWWMALSSDARRAAVTTPGRVWTVDLLSGQADLVWRSAGVTALAWARDGGVQHLLVGNDRGEVVVLGDHGDRAEWLDAPPLSLGLDNGTLRVVTAEGELLAVPPGGGEPIRVRACPEGAVDAATRGDGGEVLVACGGGSGVLAARVPWPPGTPHAIAGTPTARGGVSWSPGGRWFTTGSAGEGDPLILWDAAEERPVASLGVESVRDVAWSPDGTRILTIEGDGRVWLWDLATVRRERGL